MWSVTFMTRDRDDDGRVVADMSQVHVGMMDIIAPEALRTRLRDRNKSGGVSPGNPADIAGGQSDAREPIELTEGELKALLKASLKASLLLSGIFVGAGALFILFCIYIWFR